MTLDRFSPYFTEPSSYGIEHLESHETYSPLFPPSTDLHSLAFLGAPRPALNLTRGVGGISRT